MATMAGIEVKGWLVNLLFHRTHSTHALAAMVAVIFGLQLASTKGTTQHRMLGWTYVTTSSFFISELKLWGAFSPIHLLSAWTVFSLVMAVYHARQGNIRQHKNWMRLVTSLRYWSRECFHYGQGVPCMAYCWAFSTV